MLPRDHIVVLGSLELESQVVVSCPLGAGNQTSGLWRAASVCNC